MNLLKFLKENEEKSRKIFGKRELKIIEKQLNGINLTQSEKNRLSRDIREKLRFIKEVSRFEDEFELKKSSEVKKRIKQTLEVIKEHRDFKKVEKIILFGSASEKKLSFRSDIDIAVMFDKIGKKDAGKFRIHVLGRVSDKIDIQVYNTLPQKIKNQINEKGRILYERKNR